MLLHWGDYDTLYIPADLWDNDLMVDLRGIPTPVCPCCGSSLLRLTVQFDPATYEVGMYFLDNAECVDCGCLLTAPTPLDVAF